MGFFSFLLFSWKKARDKGGVKEVGWRKIGLFNYCCSYQLHYHLLICMYVIIQIFYKNRISIFNTKNLKNLKLKKKVIKFDLKIKIYFILLYF